MLEGHIGCVVLEVLLDLYLLNWSADCVEGGGIEDGAVDVFVVALEEEHVLLEDSYVLETGYNSERQQKGKEMGEVLPLESRMGIINYTLLCSRAFPSSRSKKILMIVDA